MSDFDSRARKAAAAVRRQMIENTAHHETGIRRARRSPGRVAIPSAVAAAMLIGAVMVGLPQGGGGAALSGGNAALAMTGALQPFTTCDSVLEHFKDHAPEYLIERARHRGGLAEDGAVPATSTRQSGRSGADSSATAAEAGSEPAYSTTNVQEAGVDEPDIIKTDGDRIVAVARERVHLVGFDGGRMALRKILPDTMVHHVFLSGERLLVFGGRAAQGSTSVGRWADHQAVLTLYDISDLRDPELIARLTIDGQVLDARLVGTQVRVTTVSSPDVDAPSPVYAPDGGISPRSELQLRAAVANSEVDDWIPAYTLQNGAGGQVSAGRLVDCADLGRPRAFSGLDTVAMSSFDIKSALQSRHAVGVIASGQQMYATSSSTYVSTTEWSRDGSPAKTNVHKFVTVNSGANTYNGSGEVPGTLLNQYAMSEYDGVLRVASTVSERRGWANPREVTEGLVTTLGEQDGALRQLGQVDGLGRADNESIRAVRFIEDRGYVVTYRQTDPLYVLDLRDAAAPKILGALKIPGYSGYLHPVGKNLLLGLGQSGRANVQFSLFDITDPALPRRIDKQTYGQGAAGAEFDPKAFLYWQPRNLIIAPAQLYGDQKRQGAFSGVVLLRATNSGLAELGRLGIADTDGGVNRSLVIGDKVYLLSDQALQANSLDTHRRIDKLDL